MKTSIVLVLMLLLVSCAGAPKKELHTLVQYKVIRPPESLYRCPDVPLPPPAPETPSAQLVERYDRQVADYILELYKTGRVCKESLQDVRDFIEQAGIEVEKANEKAKEAETR